MIENKKTGFKRLLILIVYIVYGLYYVQDMKTSANVVIKQTESRGTVHLLLIMLIGVLALYMLCQTVFSGVLRVSNVNGPMIFIFVWTVFTGIMNNSGFWSIAVQSGLVALWVLVMFFMRDAVADTKTYKMVLLFEYVIWLITMYYAVVALSNFSSYNEDDNAGGVLNISYNVLVLLPFLLQLKNKLIKYSSILISCGFIVLSMKRGSIIAMILMLLIYIYVNYKNGEIKITFVRIALVLGLFVFAFIMVNKITNNFLVSRFTLESLIHGSNREILYSSAINDILNRNFVEFMIGKGGGSSLTIIGSGVHNEILEMLFSYGFIGLCGYLWLIISGLRLVFKLMKEKNDASAIYAMSVVYIVFVGLVGTALFAHYTFHIMASVGLSAGYLRREKENY